MAGGDTYTIIYLKLQLLSLDNEGIVVLEGVEDKIADELALELDESLEDVQMTILFLENHGLLEELSEEELLLPKAVECMGSENKSAERVRRYREKQKALQSNEDLLQCNTAETESNTEKEKEREKEKYINCAPKGAHLEFFESIWLLYPNKRGKGKVSEKKKKELYKIGYEELKRAIERYTQDLERDGWRQAQNGSTFFNSGYLDYLDVNYRNNCGNEESPTTDLTPEQIQQLRSL